MVRSSFHPGGLDELLRGAGKDCTDAFDEIHQWVNVEGMLGKYAMGKLSLRRYVARTKRRLLRSLGLFMEPFVLCVCARPPSQPNSPPPALDLVRWAPVRLLSKQHITSSWFQFRFGLVVQRTSQKKSTAASDVDNNNNDSKVLLPSLASCGGYPGQHLELMWRDTSGKVIVRPYTPTSDLNVPGEFELAVKVYPLPAGKMGRYLAALPVGATIACWGMMVSC